jgi:hypothetical protein
LYLNLFLVRVEGNVDNLPVKEYTLTIREEIVNKAGVAVKGMMWEYTGSCIDFTEGVCCYLRKNEYGNIHHGTGLFYQIFMMVYRIRPLRPLPANA